MRGKKCWFCLADYSIYLMIMVMFSQVIYRANSPPPRPVSSAKSSDVAGISQRSACFHACIKFARGAAHWLQRLIPPAFLCQGVCLPACPAQMESGWWLVQCSLINFSGSQADRFQTCQLLPALSRTVGDSKQPLYLCNYLKFHDGSIHVRPPG